MFFEPLAHNRLQLTQAVGRQSCVHFGVLLRNSDFKVGVLLVERADLVSLGPDSLLLRIVEHLVKNASLAPTRVESWLLLKVAEEITQKCPVVLRDSLTLPHHVVASRVDHLHVDHVVVVDSVVVDYFLGVVAEDLGAESEDLALGVDRGLDRNEALEFFDGGVLRDLNVVELVVARNVLHQERDVFLTDHLYLLLLNF